MFGTDDLTDTVAACVACVYSRLMSEEQLTWS